MAVPLRLRLAALMCFAAAVPSHAGDAGPVSARLMPAGRDFCLTRSYDAAHLAKAPRQIITAITIAGRNAGADEAPRPVGAILATLEVRFKDRAEPLLLPGSCREGEGSDREGRAAVRCQFVVPDFADMLAQDIWLEPGSKGRAKAHAGADWKVLRAGTEPDGPYGGVTTDDADFLLDVAAPASCSYPKAYWTDRGPTGDEAWALP